MAKPIIMPQVGQDIQTAVILEWRVRENDCVQPGDILFVVESDKAVFEIEADEPGMIIKILYHAGETAEVFKPVAYLGEPGETIGDIQKLIHDHSSHEKGALTGMVPHHDDGVGRGERIFATPSARRIASEHQIELSAVTGSGPDGHICRDDVLRALEYRSDGKKTVGQNGDESTVLYETIVEFSGRRKILAERLTRSIQTIPHFYLTIDVDMTAVLEERKRYNRTSETRVSVNDIIMKVVAQVLKEFPELNAHGADGSVIVHRRFNIGFAVCHKNELYVPVLTDADRRTLAEISRLSREMIQGTRSGRIKKAGQGTFTITNLSMYPVRFMLPIINPPECAILGVGGIQKRVVPEGNTACTVRSMATLTLACDHRVIDGVYAARFLKALKRMLENLKPET